MDRSSTQRLISMLCLVAFGLGQSFFASMGVRCTDQSGETRIEYVCIKSDAGSCRGSCNESGVRSGGESNEGDRDAPAPCRDEPLGLQASAARVAPVGVSLAPVFAEVVVSILSDRWSFEDAQPSRKIQSERGRDRPPDSRARLRSVILIV